MEGLPLGLLPDPRYDPRVIYASPGDVVIVCSDGLLEAENARGEEFESTKLESALGDLVDGNAQEIADGLNQAALEFVGERARQNDDYTVVVLRFK